MIWNIVLASTLAICTGPASMPVQSPAFDFGFVIPQSDQNHPEPPSPAVPPIVFQSGINSSSVTPIQVTPSPATDLTWNMDTLQGDAAPTYHSVYGKPNPAEQKLVSVSFHDAHAGDVFSWLDHHGVNYAISDSSLKSKSISMNMVNQPLYQVVDAIAAALGGRWSREGQIRVFRTGAVSLFSNSNWNQPALNSFKYSTTPLTFSSQKYEGVKLFGKFDAKSLLKSLTPEQKKLQETRGFLRFDDFTPSQRSLYPFNPHGTVKIEIEIDGQKLVIKNP